MAKKATGSSSASKSSNTGSTRKTSTAVARRSPSRDSGGSGSKENMGEAFIKLLQSPLVAELMAVAATAALAALAEHGFTSGENARGKRAGKAVKEAGKAAAAAIGRRLANEFDEIREAAKQTRSSAKA